MEKKREQEINSREVGVGKRGRGFGCRGKGGKGRMRRNTMPFLSGKQLYNPHAYVSKLNCTETRHMKDCSMLADCST